MKVIFTTHGETLQNLENILQGQSNGELSPKGKEQKMQLAETLKCVPIDFIYTSSLARCEETANEVAKYHSNAVFKSDSRLKARHMGVFEGRKKNDAEWSSLEGDYYSNRPTGGESLTETWNRVKQVYEEIKQLPENSTVYIVAHGETKIILEALIKNIPMNQAFTGHDMKGGTPIILEPKKAEIVTYELHNTLYKP